MKKIALMALSIAVLLAFARAAVSHEIKVDEPDHPLQIVAVVLHPIGSLLDHVFLGRRHPPPERPEQLEQPGAPKYNFQPRSKHPRD